MPASVAPLQPDEELLGGTEVLPRVSVFVPAHNEAENVEPLLERIEQGLAACNTTGTDAVTPGGLIGPHGTLAEVVFVDDGSTDGTGEIADALRSRFPWLRVIRHRRNLGLTEAMRTGFRAVRGDVVLFLPADLECHPDEDIPKLLDKLSEGYDVVAGWRQGRKGGKLFASAIYNAASRRLFQLDVHDMNWIKGFRREVIDDLPPLRSDWHRFVLILAASQGWRVGEVVTQWYPRSSGRSHYGFSRIPVSFLDVLVVKFLLTFRRNPMRFFGGLGMVLIGIALSIGAYLLYLWVSIGRQQRPVFQFAVNLAVAGLLLFLVGFVAELVVSQSVRIDEVERDLRMGRHLQTERHLPVAEERDTLQREWSEDR
ncbi:MAG: glycosyltransferase family 2 protein [Anaerolineae bacterium]|jgi:glycosyltransferase involved in cell wall biosynthesis